jgi:hypothetical protein
LELALNIAWLILSASLVILGATCGKPGRRTNEQRVAVFIALTCLIAFLFPVISMTDDLNSAAVLPETNQSKQWIGMTSMFAIVTAAFVAAFSVQSSAWAGGSILAASPRISQDAFAFDLSRRPPPAI